MKYSQILLKRLKILLLSHLMIFPQLIIRIQLIQNFPPVATTIFQPYKLLTVSLSLSFFVKKAPPIHHSTVPWSYCIRIAIEEIIIQDNSSYPLSSIIH